MELNLKNLQKEINFLHQHNKRLNTLCSMGERMNEMLMQIMNACKCKENSKSQKKKAINRIKLSYDQLKSAPIVASNDENLNKQRMNSDTNTNNSQTAEPQLKCIHKTFDSKIFFHHNLFIVLFVLLFYRPPKCAQISVNWSKCCTKCCIKCTETPSFTKFTSWGNFQKY